MPGYWNAHSDLDFEDRMNERCPDDDPDDERCWWFDTEAEFRAALAEERRLLALFPGFTIAQIMAGLTVPACEETKE